MLDDTWVCKECCASNVEEQVGVKINSYQGDMAEVTTDVTGGGLFFCPECEMNVQIVQYCDFAVDNNDEDVENNRLSQIMSEADGAMQRFVDKNNKKGE